MTQFKVDFNDFKRRDNTNLMEITLYKDNGEQIIPNRDHQWSGKALKFGDGDKRLDQELAVTLDGDKIGVPSKQLENLPSGDYGLELWEVNNDSKTIYPSAGFIEFHIHRNADESLESVTPTTDLDKIIDDLHQAGLNVVVDGIEMLAPDATPSVTSEVRDGKNHIKLYIPHGLDNATLATAPAFKALQTQVNNSSVGTNLLTGTTKFDFSFVNNLRTQIVTQTVQKYDDETNYIQYTSNTPIDNIGLYWEQPTPKVGQVYTFSADVCGNGYIPGYHFRYEGGDVGSLGQVDLTNDWKRISNTFSINKASGAWVIYVNNSTLLKIKNVKIEKGSVATDWCPNPTEIMTQSDYAKIKAAIVALGGSLS